MNSIHVVNIKCGGCEASIVSALQRAGLSKIKVDVGSQLVSFEGDADEAKKILTKMGYPEADSPKARKLSKKAKSYITCAVGKMKK